MFTRSLARLLMPLVICTFSPLVTLAQPPSEPPSVTLSKPSIVFKIQSPTERLEMTIRTSRILTMDQKIPQAQVNNPEILELTPLSPTQIQVSAKAVGVTQVNLWGEDKKLFTVDVIVYGDAQELTMMLRSTFPNAALKVVPTPKGVIISGFVDEPESIDRIIRIAEEYFGKDKVINNMTVGGCQQVLLHVKIMEVSRTKLRKLGFDWGKITGSNTVVSGVSGLMSDISTQSQTTGVYRTETPSTFAFGILNGSSGFYGVLNALREDALAKILAEPTLTTISGRPASFRAGGSFYIIPNGQNGGAPITVKYGTQLDFVPIVLGNGRIHLEVRSTISEPDPSLPAAYQPALKDRIADTGAELQAGQTLAIAGLVQSRTESSNAGLPWISEVPYLGLPFRNVREQVNEIELLIMVTPELTEAMDESEVPPCGPGAQTTNPSDWELFMKGHIEVPRCCPASGTAECQHNGVTSDSLPPDGMILGPDEKIPTPPPAAGAKSSSPHSRYSVSRRNTSSATSSPGSSDSPPGFIGPVGYDVVK